MQLRDKVKEFERRNAQVLVVDREDSYRVRYMLRYAKRDRRTYQPRPVDRFLETDYRWDKVKRWLLPSGELAWPILADPAATVGAGYGLAFQRSLDEYSHRPATFVIDREGVIRFEHRVYLHRGDDESPDPDELLWVLDDLGEKRALIAALKNEDAQLGRAVGLVLGPVGPETKAAVPSLSAALQCKDTRVRAGAAAALCWIAPQAEAASPALSAALKDNDAQVRRLSAEALWRIGPKDKAAVPELIQGLTDDEARFRAAVVSRLERMGPVAFAGFVEALKHEDTRVRVKAAETLCRFVPEVAGIVPALVAALKDKDARVRLAVAIALDRSRYDWVTQGPAMSLSRLKEKHAATRSAAAHALLDRIIGAFAEIDLAIPALTGAQKDQDEKVREAAAGALDRFKSAITQARVELPAYIETLKDKDPQVRAKAASILERTGGATARAGMPALIEALKDKDGQVRERGIIAFAIPVLIKALKDEVSSLRAGAALALGRFGAAAKTAVPALSAARKDSDAEVRQAAAEALKQIDPEAAKKPEQR